MRRVGVKSRRDLINSCSSPGAWEEQLNSTRRTSHDAAVSSRGYPSANLPNSTSRSVLWSGPRPGLGMRSGGQGCEWEGKAMTTQRAARWFILERVVRAGTTLSNGDCTQVLFSTKTRRKGPSLAREHAILDDEARGGGLRGFGSSYHVAVHGQPCWTWAG